MSEWRYGDEQSISRCVRLIPTFRAHLEEGGMRPFCDVGTHTLEYTMLHRWWRKSKYCNSMKISSFISVITKVRNGWSILHTKRFVTTSQSREARAWHVMRPCTTTASPLRLKQHVRNHKHSIIPRDTGLADWQEGVSRIGEEKWAEGDVASSSS